MKKVDVTGEVMDRVVRFERQRTRRWIGMFILTLLIGVFLFLGSIYILANQLFEEEVSSLLIIYLQDKEILGLIWQDIVSFVWDVIPHQLVFFAGFVALMLIFIVVVTGHKRRVILRRLKEMKERNK